MYHLNGHNWVLYQGALVPDTAPHVNHAVNQKEVDRLMKESNAHFLRWTSDFDYHHETEFWYIIKDNPASLDELSKNTRNQVRKALKYCRVERTDAAYIADAGYLVRKKAFDGYNNASGSLLDQDFFTSSTARKANDPSWEFWGVWNQDGSLIAYSQNKICGNICTYSTVDIDPKYRKLNPGYALFFTMNVYYLNKKNFRYVNDGARSVSHSTNIQQFLIRKLKFRKAYCRLHVEYSSQIKILVILLYPIRGLIGKIGGNLPRLLSVLLKQEEIRRSFRS